MMKKERSIYLSIITILIIFLGTFIFQNHLEKSKEKKFFINNTFFNTIRIYDALIDYKETGEISRNLNDYTIVLATRFEVASLKGDISGNFNFSDFGYLYDRIIDEQLTNQELNELIFILEGIIKNITLSENPLKENDKLSYHEIYMLYEPLINLRY